MRTSFLVLGLIIFCLELLLTQSSGFLRHTVGDFFVVIMLYCLLRSFKTISRKKAAISVLTISFGIEFVQLTNLSESAIFQKYSILKTILGTSFSIQDLIAYSLGICLAYWLDRPYSSPST